MSKSREKILAQLGSPHPQAQMVVDKMPSAEQTMAEKTSQFSEMMTAVHAEVHHVNSADVPTKIGEILQAKHCQTIAGDSESLAEFGLANLDVIPPQSIDTTQWFKQIDAGISTAAAGIAETGSVVLFPTPRQPRRLSLVVPIHIVVLRTTALYSTLMQAMAHWPEPLPTNVVLVSGPSKTADIEQVLAYGVHGPKSLVVVLIDD